MEEKILAIIKKVRDMYRFDNRYGAILKANPSIELSVGKGNSLKIDSISWNYYDSIYVTSKQITMHPEHGSPTTLIKYNGWDGLLNL